MLNYPGKTSKRPTPQYLGGTINDFRKPDFVQHAKRWSVACYKYLTNAGHAFVAETAQHLLRDVPDKFKSSLAGDLTHALKDMFEAFPILKNVSFSGT